MRETKAKQQKFPKARNSSDLSSILPPHTPVSSSNRLSFLEAITWLYFKSTAVCVHNHPPEAEIEISSDQPCQQVEIVVP